MIDYLFAFEDGAAAAAALPSYRRDGAWDESCVLPVWIGVGEEYAGLDPETGELITRPVYASGYWLVVSTSEVDDALWAIPQCMREADREAAARGAAYVLRDRFTAAQLAIDWWVTPVWAGATYPFNPPAE